MLDAFPPPVMPEFNYDEAALALWAHMYEEARASEPRDFDGNRGYWWHGSLGAAIRTVWPALSGRQIANAQASIAPRLRKRNMLANIKAGTGSNPSVWWVAMPPSGVTGPANAGAQSEPEPAQVDAPQEHAQDAAPALPPASLAVFAPEPAFEPESESDPVLDEGLAEHDAEQPVAAPSGASSGLERLQEMIDAMVLERTGAVQGKVEAVRKGLYGTLDALDELRAQVHGYLDLLN